MKTLKSEGRLEAVGEAKSNDDTNPNKAIKRI